MKFARLNVQQHRSLIGQDLGDGTLFNPVMHKTGYIVISEWEIQQVTNTDFLWLQDLPLVDMDSLNMPDTTPPSMTGYGILLPTECENLGIFPNNQFNLNGFVIEFTTTQQGLAVDLGYLGWQEFRDEQDNEVNSAIKMAFSNLWYEVLARYQNNEIIQL